jgi:hypothetical protein
VRLQSKRSQRFRRACRARQTDSILISWINAEGRGKMGLARFQDIHEQLELTSQRVDEMSAMSQKIARTLCRKKQEREPKVHQIKEKREHFQQK